MVRLAASEQRVRDETSTQGERVLAFPWTSLADNLPFHTVQDAALIRMANDPRLSAVLRTCPGLREDVRVLLAENVVPPASTVWVELGQAGQSLWLGLDGARIPALYSLVLPRRPGEPHAPSALRRGIAGQLLAPLLRAMRSLMLPEVAVLDVCSSVRTSPSPQWWRLDLWQDDNIDYQVWFNTPPSIWLDELKRRIAARPVIGHSPLSLIEIPARLILGRKAVRVQTMRAMRSGDVLLSMIDPITAAAINARTLFTAQLRWAGATTPHTRRFLQATVDIDGTQITCNEAPRMTQTLDEEIPDPDAPEVALAFEEIELPVQIDVCTPALTAADIAALRAGQILALPVAVRDAQIRLTVFGQLVATGELVCVGDHLGVRILSTVHA